ncbi:MAG: hypothetical protein JWM11_506 [Planctomycetaceae bacterium]|nr:hypothetical protein [Planctomycetaceae bacterium]
MFGSRDRKLAALLPLAPRRSLFVAACGVVSRGFVWALLIFALNAIVPRTLMAMQGLNPKLQVPVGPFTRMIDFMCDPTKACRLAAFLLGCIDLPISYLISNSIASRRLWGRTMMLIPLGIGLIAGAGFVVLYLQLIALQVKDAGI